MQPYHRQAVSDENVPRMLKEGTRAVIEKDSYPVLPIFKLLAKTGDIEEKMMYTPTTWDLVWFWQLIRLM